MESGDTYIINEGFGSKMIISTTRIIMHDKCHKFGR
jgi:hypothetical protein